MRIRAWLVRGETKLCSGTEFSEVNFFFDPANPTVPQTD